LKSKLAAKAVSTRTVRELQWSQWSQKFQPISNSSGDGNLIFTADDEEIKSCDSDCLWVVWSNWASDDNLYYYIDTSDSTEPDHEDFCGYLITKIARDEDFDEDELEIAAIDVMCDEGCGGDEECEFCKGEDRILVSFVGPVELQN
jgi:hypothetical protein